MSRAPRLRSVLAVAAALLIVSSVGAGPALAPVEPVAAADGDESPCHGITVTVFTSGTGCEQLYDAAQHDFADHLEAYSHGTSIIAGNQEYFAIYGNYMEDSKAAAWMDAEVETAEAYQNGSTQTQAQIAATEDVRDYYSIHELNLRERWNHSVAAFDNLKSQASGQWDLFDPFVEDAGNGSTAEGEFDPDENVSVAFVNRSLTLSNGSTRDVRAIEVTMDVPATTGTGSIQWNTVTKVININSGETFFSNGYDDGGLILKNWNLNPPSADYSTRIYKDLNIWKDRWQKANETKNEVVSGVEDFVAATYADYDDGTLNATDILSRLTLAQEYRLEAGQDAAEGNQTFNSVLASLRVQGFETASLNETGSFNVTYRTNASDPATERTETGFLFARTAPNGTLETGATYHVTDDLGSAVFVKETGETRVPEGNLTINSIKDRNGTELTNVSTTSVNYEVANTSEYHQTLEEIGKTLEEIEDTQTGGVPPDGDGPGSWSLVVGLVVLAAVALLAGRGGGR